MKKNTLALTLLMAGALHAGTAQGALNFSDWKVAGDQRALIDTDTGIEWLRLPETKGLSIHETKQLLATQFLGWRLPTAAEVEQMMDNFYPYTINAGQTLYTWDSNVPIVNDWITMFGANGSVINATSRTVQTYGLYYSNPTTLSLQMSGAAYQRVQTGYSTYRYQSNIYEDISSQDYNELFKGTTIGIFLVSDGGTSLSSLLNPFMNIMNPRAPINNPLPPPPVTNVPVSGVAGMALALFALAGRRRVARSTQ